MGHSLFDLLESEDLNRLRIGYDWRTGEHHLYAAKSWDDDINWAGYNKTFSISSTLTPNAAYHNADATRAFFKKNGASDYLAAVNALLRKGRHLFIDCFYCRKKNIRFMNHVHSDTLGRNNRSHATCAGGIRRHEPGEAELDVIVDGLNLSRGMSFKNFAARIPYGGNKMTVIMDPVDLDDLEALGFLSYALDMSATFTGPDMGFPLELADAMKAHFTLNITGGPAGPLGPTGTPTAFGTYLAVKEAVRLHLGRPSLRGTRIAVQGLGAVGSKLCDHYLAEGASLLVADIDPAAIERLRRRHADADVTTVAPGAIIFEDADVFSPCATGGIVSDEVIPRLKFKIILGGANNQLRASSQEEECSLARRLQHRGILFQVAWWHNLGGVLCGFEEYVNQEAASMNNVLAKVERICTEYTASNLVESRDGGITPTENAYRSAEDGIYPR